MAAMNSIIVIVSNQSNQWPLPFGRPFIPISKLTVSESYESYISRSDQVTKDILSDCQNTGKGQTWLAFECVFVYGCACACMFAWWWTKSARLSGCSVSPGSKVLLVAHASSLDACTRQLQGRGHQSPQDFIQVVRKVRPRIRLWPLPSP